MEKLKSRRALKWITREPNGIMNLPEAKEVGMSSRDRALMLDQLKRLYSWDFLGGLDDSQIFDLFEEKILLPGLSHIKHKKPVKPRPDSNIYDLTVDDDWWLIRPKPELEDEEEI